MPKGSILVVDDEAEIREGLELLLSSEGYTVTTAETGEAGLARLENSPSICCCSTSACPTATASNCCAKSASAMPNLPVVLITAYGSIDMARAAFKSGAQDYITKPWSNDELLVQVALAVEGRRLREENVQLKRALKQRYNFPNIIGKSEKIVAVLDLVAQVAPSRSTVLITGESGTGKELIAKAIHSASTRADKPFVPVNSGSIPVDLLESQLFGHVKGAFTSAVASKKGLFEVADQGTIFFDEISTIEPGNAGQAAARDPGARIHAPGRHGNDQGGRAHPGGLQRRAAPTGARRPFPRGSVSSPERDRAPPAAAARAPRRRSAAAGSFSAPLLGRKSAGPCAALRPRR